MTYSFPRANVPVLDDRTRQFTRDWYLYQQSLYSAAGGGATGTSTDVLHGGGAGWGKVVLTADVSGILPVGNGGTGITFGSSGGVPYFSAVNTLTSSAALSANQLVLGGGIGGAPSTPLSLGTTTTVLHGNAAGAPTWGAVSLTTDVTGTLQAAQAPAFSGDVASSAGSLSLTLANSGVIAGTYTKLTVDAKGRATTGTTASASDLSNGTTGSGAIVLATSPTLTSPILGIATATSINKVSLTAPATGSTLTVADGKTLTASNTVTLQATDGAAINAGNGITSGTYTPTLTDVLNVTGSTAFTCYYTRIGDMVHVAGFANVDPTAAGTVQLGVSIPIASNFTVDNQLAGTGVSIGASTNQPASVYADSANDRAQIQYEAVDTSNKAMAFHFSYRVL